MPVPKISPIVQYVTLAAQLYQAAAAFTSFTHVTESATGVDLCALDQPQLVVTATDTLYCTLYCTQNNECLAVNYYMTTQQCHVFYTQPSIFYPVLGCHHYTVCAEVVLCIYSYATYWLVFS